MLNSNKFLSSCQCITCLMHNLTFAKLCILGHSVHIRCMQKSCQTTFFSLQLEHHCTVHRGAFCPFLFRWIYYCHSSKYTGKKTDKTHLCAVQWSLLKNLVQHLKNSPFQVSFETFFKLFYHCNFPKNLSHAVLLRCRPSSFHSKVLFTLNEWNSIPS